MVCQGSGNVWPFLQVLLLTSCVTLDNSQSLCTLVTVQWEYCYYYIGIMEILFHVKGVS